MRFNTIVCSYIFFAILSFNTLALLSSEFSHTFSQVFLLLAQDGKTYDILCLILLSIALLFGLINPIRIYTRKEVFGKTVPFIIMLVAILTISCLLIIFYHIYNKISFNHGLVNESILESKKITSFTQWQEYYMSIEFIVALICWVCLIILPLCYKMLSSHIDIKNRIGKSLRILEPSITTISIGITASAFHPYFSDTASRYTNMLFFYTGTFLLLYVLLRTTMTYRFYEYANILLLSISILLFLLCGRVILMADFYNVQFSFYVLAILSWCGEWVENRDILYNRIT